MTKPYIESTWCKQDAPFESQLRPRSLLDFSGQDRVRERLEIVIGAAKLRNEPLGHCLFFGPPGLGKTTLAGIIAKAMGTQLISTSGPVLDKAGDLAGILTHLKRGDILFIDEIHRLSRSLEEYLYPAIEDFQLDLMIDSGPAARSVQVQLNPFTLVAATTRVGLLTAPMRSRFHFTCRLDYYEPNVLQKILIRSSNLLGMSITEDGAAVIAQRARGTPRIANNLLRWTRDFAQIRNAPTIDHNMACQALTMLSIDDHGLDELDKKILATIIDHHNGGPVGLNTLAAALGEEADTIAEVYEPYLIMQGFLQRTPRGREATPRGYQHMQQCAKTSAHFSQDGERR